MGIARLAGPKFKYSHVGINPLLIENSRRSAKGRNKFEKHCAGGRKKREIYIYMLLLLVREEIYIAA